MEIRQFWAALFIAIFLFVLIVRLVQKGKLDIVYSWIWIGMGICILLVVVKYDLLVLLTGLIGAATPTTTLFIFAILINLMLCLQFSIVTSQHRNQIKKLTQQLAIITEEKSE
jgi:hypothetical protein